MRAEVEAGYNAIQRLLLDLERFGHVLHGLHVVGVDGDDRLMRFEAWISGSGSQSGAVLSARLERHFGVFSAVVRQVSRPDGALVC